MSAQVHYGVGFPQEKYLEGKAWAEDYVRKQGFSSKSFYEHTVIFGDIDQYWHVNNARYNLMVDTSKSLWNAALVKAYKPSGNEGSIATTVLVESKYKYRFPPTWPDVLFVAARVGEVDERAFTTEIIIVSTRHRKVVCETTTKDRAFDVKAAKGTTYDAWWVEALKRDREEALARAPQSSKL